MSKAVNSKWKKTFPDTIGNQNRPATGVDDTQEFETGAFPQYMANDPVRYDLQNAAMSQLMSNDARLKEMVDARGKELDDHKVDPGAHKTGIAGNAATATKVVTTAATGASANIAEASMGGSDSARIRVSGAENAGELALETANDGDEAIVARQYTGVYTNAVRTAKILDESGNTSFPGTVVAPKFTGTLNGNASTATKLATPRTLSLSGKAAGSTSFDGSANATINVTNVNADTASKLSTARKINITGNATGAANFDGSADANISVTVNESKHAAAADTLKSSPATETSTVARPVWLSWEGDNTKQTVSPNLTYTCSTKTLAAANFKGHLAGNADTATKATQDTNGRAFTDTNAYMHISALANNTDFNNVKTTGIYYCTGNTYSNRPHNSWGILTVYSIGTVKQEYRPDNAAVYYTREYDNAKWNAWSKVNAANADTVDGVHAGSFFYNKGNWADDNWGTMGAYQTNGTPPVSDWYGWGQVISSSTNDARFQLYASDNISVDGRLHYRTGWDSRKNQWNTILDSENYNLFAPTKTGSGASGTWGINITGNAATATNADKLDGYHASDLFRHLGGNQTPVITDIFDRAGTIDMSTMSAADKAKHKANINKAQNMTQGIWNNGSGIHAYGGDYDIAGYNRGTLKLTQSWRNFDKILVVGVNDKGDLLIYKLWDVWALANAFASGSYFQLFHGGGDYWFLYGSTRKGTNTNYVLSTDTVWSCQDQNSGIVAIYGIKY